MLLVNTFDIIIVQRVTLLWNSMLISVSHDWETVKNVFTGKQFLETGSNQQRQKCCKQSKMLNNSAYSRLGNNEN